MSSHENPVQRCFSWGFLNWSLTYHHSCGRSRPASFQVARACVGTPLEHLDTCPCNLAFRASQTCVPQRAERTSVHSDSLSHGWDPINVLFTPPPTCPVPSVAPVVDMTVAVAQCLLTFRVPLYHTIPFLLPVPPLFLSRRTMRIWTTTSTPR